MSTWTELIESANINEERIRKILDDLEEFNNSTQVIVHGSDVNQTEVKKATLEADNLLFDLSNTLSSMSTSLRSVAEGVDSSPMRADFHRHHDILTELRESFETYKKDLDEKLEEANEAAGSKTRDALLRERGQINQANREMNELLERTNIYQDELDKRTERLEHMEDNVTNIRTSILSRIGNVSKALAKLKNRDSIILGVVAAILILILLYTLFK